MRWFRRKKTAPQTPAKTTALYGGMQVRELQTRLELLVDPSLNDSRSLLQVAQSLAKYGLAEQRRFLDAVARLADQDYRLAASFCHEASGAIETLSDADWPTWVDEIIRIFGVEGLESAEQFVRSFRPYSESMRRAPAEVRYAEVAAILTPFVQALANRSLRLNVGPSEATDARSFYFPEQLSSQPSSSENFQLYKAYAAHQWAQLQFGTWDEDLQPALNEFPDRARALEVFKRLETYRLDACIDRELPGLARTMRAFRGGKDDLTPMWREAVRALAHPNAKVPDTLAWLAKLYADEPLPAPAQYEHVLLSRPESIDETPQKDVKQAKQLDSSNWDPDETPTEEEELPSPGDQDEAPEEADLSNEVYEYDEWDHARQRYREHWCLLREQIIEGESDNFRGDTLAKYRGTLGRIKRSFEALRQEHQPSRREADGDEIDLNALVESLADFKSGLEMNEKLYLDSRRVQRDVGALFLLDMSLSTRGWVNQLEREALILMCEALEVLGDRYAVYGFSGQGPRQCVSYRIKTFEEPYDMSVWKSISGIRPQQFTRMGVAIRHHSALLHALSARTKLLIVLSDGQPDDQDGYRGAYAIEDTRKALIESRSMSLHPFCITIDRNAKDYLPHMYGPGHFVVIDQLEALPRRIGEIYRKLTT